MDKLQCTKQRLSARGVGLLILAAAFLLGAIGFIIIPILGAIFAVPLFILAGVFIFAPDSRVCQLVLKND